MNETINHKNREHALLSASSAHRWLECPASAVAAEAYPPQDTTFTQEGTLAHEVAEWVASGKSENGPALEKGVLDGVTTEMLQHGRGYRDYIQEQTKSADAVIMLERRVDFSDWVPDGFGTCDCIIIQGDTMTVIDYKYGVGVPVSAKDNPQLRLYALGALNDYGIAYDVEHIEMHIYQPRINNISTDSISAAELLEWANTTVQPIAQKAAKGKGGYKAGAHCKFCPHAGKCRTLTKTCTEYVETHSLRVAIPTLAPHEVAEVLAMEPLVTLWLKRVKEQALSTLLSGGEVPGYKAVEGKLGNRKWADEMQVAQTLRDAGYSEEDYTTVSILSPAGMDKAIGKNKAAELLGGLITRAPGAPTIAPADDKRPAYTTADDFEEIGG
jgi:hypothetical protein